MSNATISGESEQKNIRSGPGTVYKILHTADPGDRVKIIGSSSDSGGYLWYKVNLLKSGVQGWIAAQLVVVDSPSNLEAANSEVNPTPLSPESSTREVSKVAHQGYCTFLATDSQGNMINNQCTIYDQNDGTYQLKWSDGFLTTIAVTPKVEIDGVPASIVQQSSTSLTVIGPKGKIGFCWSCQP
jgi:Bacterial SH3 domain